MTPNTNVSEHSTQVNAIAASGTIISNNKLRLIKKKEVLELACISKSTLHLKQINGLFPPSISLGERAVAFVEYEVLAVIAAQIQGQTKEQIKDLVTNLIANRQTITIEVN